MMMAIVICQQSHSFPEGLKALAATDVDTEAMAVTAVDTATARGLLSLATATVVDMVMDTADTTVSYHQIRRSELSQKQNSQK